MYTAKTVVKDLQLVPPRQYDGPAPTITNRKPGECETCGGSVAVGEGKVTKDGGGTWHLDCAECFGKREAG